MTNIRDKIYQHYIEMLTNTVQPPCVEMFYKLNKPKLFDIFTRKTYSVNVKLKVMNASGGYTTYMDDHFSVKTSKTEHQVLKFFVAYFKMNQSRTEYNVSRTMPGWLGVTVQVGKRSV